MGEAVRHGLDSVHDSIAETLRDIKPKLRGWLHLGDRPADAGRRDRADRAVAQRLTRDRLGRLHRVRAAAVHGLRDLPHRHLVAADVGVPAPLRPLQHLPADRRLLHAVRLMLLEGTERVVLLVDRVDRGDPRRAVPGLLDRRPALALHADLHRDGLGRGLLHPRLLRRRHRASAAASASRRS